MECAEYDGDSQERSGSSKPQTDARDHRVTLILDHLPAGTLPSLFPVAICGGNMVTSGGSAKVGGNLAYHRDHISHLRSPRLVAGPQEVDPPALRTLIRITSSRSLVPLLSH